MARWHWPFPSVHTAVLPHQPRGCRSPGGAGQFAGVGGGHRGPRRPHGGAGPQSPLRHHLVPGQRERLRAHPPRHGRHATGPPMQPVSPLSTDTMLQLAFAFPHAAPAVRHGLVTSRPFGAARFAAPDVEAVFFDAGYIRARDPSRPLHYEGGGFTTPATDIICPMCVSRPGSCLLQKCCLTDAALGPVPQPVPAIDCVQCFGGSYADVKVDVDIVQVRMRQAAAWPVWPNGGNVVHAAVCMMQYR